jgi:hypothetical protein
MRIRLVALLLVLPTIAEAQSALPVFVPVNPVLASRSALYAQPLVAPSDGWRHSVIIDYSNAIESTGAADGRSYLLDAELFQLDLWLGRDLGDNSFGFVNLPIRGGYNGVLDPFLNWYHDLIGLPVPARNERPENTFGWEFELPDTTVVRESPGTFLGDIRLGYGHRFGNIQLVFSVTLPSTTTKLDGWGRKKIGTSLALTSSLLHTDRIDIDGSLAVGWTPSSEALKKYQKTVFAGGMAAMRWRFSGSQMLFATLWSQTANWQDTEFRALESPEVTLDFGALFRIRDGWPALQVGMTEDLVPRGPSVDAGFKLGVHW